MTMYAIIISIAILQYLSYSTLDKKGVRFPKWLFLLLLLLGQLFLFPQLLFSAYGFDEKNCGMPIFALHLFFFLFGGSLNIVTHIIYNFISKKTA